MTTAYTSLLGLALPTTGELQGTWGDTVNNSITSLLDSAVAGTTTLSTDGDVTLTTTTGAANQARQAILLCSGARTAVRTITAPAQSKIYTVINATSGGYAVKLIGAGPTTGVTVPAGSSGTFAWNGSDFVDVSNYVSGNKVINGNLTVNGNTTLGDASGDSVTINAGTTTFVQGTANGVAYLNGSKVLTTGSALTFDGATLGVGVAGSAWDTLKAIDLGSGGAVYGTAGQGGITSNAYYGTSGFTYKATNGAGLYQLVADSHRWATAASGTGGTAITFAEQMRLTSTGLGIGTSSPSYRLTAVKATGGDVAQFTNAAANNKSAYIYTDNQYVAFSTGTGTLGVSLLMDSTNSKMNFQINNSILATLDSSGNLGLGVTPSAWGATAKAFQFGSYGAVYNISNFVGLSNNIYYDGTNTKYINTAAASYYSQGGGEHTWFKAPSGTAGAAITFTQAMTLDASGNLGIGTSSPAARLHVLESNSSGTMRLGGATYYGSIQHDASTTGANIYNSQDTGGHLFQNSGSTVLTLNNSGNLGLGVTPSAWGSSHTAFQIGARGSLWAEKSAGNTYLSNNLYFNGTNYIYIGSAAATQYTQTAGQHQWNIAASGTAGNAISFTQAMTLDASGNLGVGTTSPAGRVNVSAYDSSNSVGGSTAAINITNSDESAFSRTSNLIFSTGTGTLPTNRIAAITGIYTGFSSSRAGALAFSTDNGSGTFAERARIDSSGNVQVGTGAIATNATDGFLYIPTCAGTPTGTPTAKTGLAPMVIDSTNNKMYIYSGGAWVALN